MRPMGIGWTVLLLGASGLACVSKGDTTVNAEGPAAGSSGAAGAGNAGSGGSTTGGGGGTTGGGAGSGGSAGTAGATGGSAGAGGSGPDLAKVSAPCSKDADCGPSLKCLDEKSSGWPKGYCYVQPTSNTCPAGTVLFASGPHQTFGYSGATEPAICAKPCANDGECSPASGYRCMQTFDPFAKYGKTACAAWAEDKAHCASGVADLGTRRCVTPGTKGNGAPCDANQSDCAGVCVFKSKKTLGDCAVVCINTAQDCNTNYTCVGTDFGTLPSPAPGVCLRNCTKPTECNGGETCDASQGVCIPP